MTDLDEVNLVQEILTKTLQLYREADKEHARSAELLAVGMNDSKFQDASWVSDALTADLKPEATGEGKDEDKASSDS